MIIIYTVCYNTPGYIEPQYTSLKKNVKDEFAYIIFNNTMTDSSITKQNIDNNNELITICKKLNIQVYNVPKHIFHNDCVSTRAGTAIDFANKLLFNNYDLTNTFFLLDSDAFLLTEFNIEAFMKNKKLSGRLQKRNGQTEEVQYITNQIVLYKPSLFETNLFFNNFSFLPGLVDSVQCDCGGNIHTILKQCDLQNDFINWSNNLFTDIGNKMQMSGIAPGHTYEFDTAYIETLDSALKDLIINDTKIVNKEFPICEIFGNTHDTRVLFLHLRAGTNWMNFDIEQRTKNLFDYLSI